MKKQELCKWRVERNTFLPFFDGASKRNPRVEGVEGVIYDPGGIIQETYSWSLGILSSNLVEVCGLYQGMKITQEK
jgi:ribonuclease HI